MSAPQMITEELLRLADVAGASVSLLFASGATIEGTLEQVDPTGQWVIVGEHLEFTVGGAQHERVMRHVVATYAVVAVGSLEVDR